jgi:hypothetical protein
MLMVALVSNAGNLGETPIPFAFVVFHDVNEPPPTLIGPPRAFLG